MGKTDTVTKDYIRNTKVFADAFNLVIYNGEQVIDAANLHEMDSTAIAVPQSPGKKRIPIQKYRDTLKYLSAMTDGETTYLILGIESQTHTHYAMPVKAELYDVLEYARQVELIARKHREEMKAQKKLHSNTKDNVQRPTSGEYLSGFWKEDTLIPVITLVIHFSSEKWDAPLSLHEMFSVKNEKILALVPDYRINFISPATMSEDDINKLQTSLREVMLYIKNSKDKEKLTSLVSADKRFRNLEREAINVINEITGSGLNISEIEEKEDVNMCKAIDDLRQEAKDDTKLEDLKNVMESLNVSPEQAVKILKISKRRQKQFLAMLQQH